MAGELLLTLVCAVQLGTVFTPPGGYYVDQVTAGNERTEVQVSTVIHYGEPFRWPKGCRSLAVEPLSSDE